MISWELMRDLSQLSGFIVGWALFVGAGIGGLVVCLLTLCWVIDVVKKHFKEWL
jgi:hypothetical protein